MSNYNRTTNNYLFSYLVLEASVLSAKGLHFSALCKDKNTKASVANKCMVSNLPINQPCMHFLTTKS